MKQILLLSSDQKNKFGVNNVISSLTKNLSKYFKIKTTISIVNLFNKNGYSLFTRLLEIEIFALLCFCKA